MSDPERLSAPTGRDEPSSLGSDLRTIEVALAGSAPLDGLAGALAREPLWLEDVSLDAHPASARDVLVRALHDLRLGAVPHLRPHLERRLAAVVGWGLGDWASGEDLLVSALEALHWSGDAQPTAAVATQLAWLRGATGDLEGQIEAAQEVAATPAHEPDRRMRAAAAAAWAAAWSGRSEEVDVLLSDLPGDAAGCPIALAVHPLGAALAGRPGDARASLYRIAPENRMTPTALEAAIVTALVGGRPADALALDDRRADWSLGEADPRRGRALALAAVAAVEAGDGLRSRRLLDALGPADNGDAGHVRWARLMVSWQEAGARMAAGGLAELVAARRSRWTALDVVTAVAAAEAAREARDADAAARTLAAVRGACERTPGTILDWLEHVCRAIVAPLVLDDADLGSRAVQAADDLDAVGASGTAAVSRAAAGRLAEAQGSHDQAVALLARSSADLQRLGARRALTSVLSDLGALGRDGRRAAAELGGAALTAREREIARLVVDGLTAQAIADRLVISRRTVETHIAHVYAKLGLGSRRELERRAKELGLT